MIIGRVVGGNDYEQRGAYRMNDYLRERGREGIACQVRHGNAL
jgi:hypothetical protein